MIIMYNIDKSNQKKYLSFVLNLKKIYTKLHNACFQKFNVNISFSYKQLKKVQKKIQLYVG